MDSSLVFTVLARYADRDELLSVVYSLLEDDVIDYSAFVARRDKAIARMEASLADAKAREGIIVNLDAKRGIGVTIKSMEARIKSLKSERVAFLALIEEFKRLDAERNPPLPLGLESAPGKKGR